jgi:predicted GTPase
MTMAKTATANHEVCAGGPALSSILQRLAEFSSQRGNAANARRVQEAVAKLASQTFNLVVFGEFKRGKTTFINALIGQDLLPSAVVPLTSVVTVLRFDERPAAKVHYLDGRVEAIATDTLADYVTEQGNPRNRKGVSFVEVGCPADLLRNGMRLVDTPGVGSVYDHNTEAARAYLPQVDGAILLVASDPPISRGECEFLREMRPHVAKLFVVQNKIDQLRPADRETSLAFTRDVLQQVLGQDEVALYPISARDALEAKLVGDSDALAASGLPEFERALRRFQEEEQSEALRRSVLQRALAVAEDELLGLQLERKAQQMTLEELERRLAEFRSRRDEALLQREDDIRLIRAEAHRVITCTLQDDYRTELRDRPAELRERLAQWAQEQADASPAALLDRGNAFIADTLHDVLGRWRQAEESRLTTQLAAVLQRFTDRANVTLSRIYEMAREMFDLPPKKVETVGYLSAPSRFLWRDWDWQVRTGLGSLPLLSFLGDPRARVLQMIERKLLDEHNLACGRLRSDFADRAREAVREYMRDVERALMESVEGVDRAMQRALAIRQGAQTQAEAAERRLSQEESEVEQILAGLRTAINKDGASVA